MLTRLFLRSFSIMNGDGSRILLGDAEGLLHLLTLEISDNRVSALCFIGLGSVSTFNRLGIKIVNLTCHFYDRSPHHPV
jgi:hypothetical protein